MIKKIFILLLLILISCSQKVEEIILYKYYVDNDFHGLENNDSTIIIHLTINTYKDLFSGRESFLSFKKQFYRINLSKIDTLYYKNTILISGSGWNVKNFFKQKIDSGYFKIHNYSNNEIKIEINLHDSLFPEILNSQYNLKFKKIDKGSSEYKTWDGLIFEMK